MTFLEFCHLVVIYKQSVFIRFFLLLSNSGLPQEEAPALTNSNVQHPHPPPTHTQGPNRLSLRYPRQLNPWSNPCPPRQPCHSTHQQRSSSLPPSLKATHTQSLSLRVSAPTECHDANAAASIITSSGSEVSYSVPTQQKTQLQKFWREKKQDSLTEGE